MRGQSKFPLQTSSVHCVTVLSPQFHMSDPFKTICSALLDDINILEEKLEISIEVITIYPNIFIKYNECEFFSILRGKQNFH